MMGRMIIGAALALPLLLAGPAYAQQRSASFTVDRTMFTVPLLPGYCDEGDGVDAYLRQQRRNYPDNVPDVVMMPCGAKDEDATDMFTITVDRKGGGSREKAALLDFLARTLPAVPGETDLSAEPGTTIVEKISTRLARRVRSEAGIRPLGVDDMCAYVGGRIDDAGGAAVSGSGCTTVIAGYIVQVSRYRAGADPAQVAATIPQVKALAISIRTQRQ
jgi:hypothetical protein